MRKSRAPHYRFYLVHALTLRTPIIVWNIVSESIINRSEPSGTTCFKNQYTAFYIYVS
jgi:hypothetical protein